MRPNAVAMRMSRFDFAKLRGGHELIESQRADAIQGVPAQFESEAQAVQKRVRKRRAHAKAGRPGVGHDHQRHLLSGLPQLARSLVGNESGDAQPHENIGAVRLCCADQLDVIGGDLLQTAAGQWRRVDRDRTAERRGTRDRCRSFATACNTAWRC